MAARSIIITCALLPRPSTVAGCAPRSVQRRLSAARSFFEYLLREGELTRNPAAGVAAPKAERRLPTTLDPDQMAQLLQSAGTTPLDLRDHALMELLYSSGLRLSELVGLDVGDLDLGDRTVRVTGKGSKTRIVPVGRYALDALAAGCAHAQRWRRPARARCS